MQKGEVKKFFDSVDQQILLKILSVKIRDEKTYKLLREIIGSFCIAGKSGGGDWVAFWKFYKPDFFQYLF